MLGWNRFCVVFLAGWMAVLGGCAGRGQDSLRDPERQIAFVWGDSQRFGPAFYGAQVYFEPAAGAVQVKARVWIGRGNGYFHDLGMLGQAATAEDAVREFGHVRFEPDGLHIGSTEKDSFFLPRDKLESHR